MSKVFRGERPQKGRFREFYQCDIDIIGIDNLPLIYDAEMPAVIYDIFKKLNFGPFIIRINNRKILNGFFDSLNLKDNAQDILRIIDKIDKIGKENVEKELLEINNDKSIINSIMTFISIKGSNDEIIKSLKDLNVSNEQFIDGINEIEQVVNYIRQFGVDEDYFVIDLTIARGLDYYTGTVYETNLVEYPGLGSICSGGRYDNLTEYYTSEHLPGIGISIGLTRLFSQLKSEGIINSTKKSLVDALVIPMNDDYNGYAIKLANELRNNNLKIDICYGNKNMKHKMKYANKIGVKYVLVIGEDEVNTNTVTLKNMIDGTQDRISVNDLIDRIK